MVNKLVYLFGRIILFNKRKKREKKKGKVIEGKMGTNIL